MISRIPRTVSESLDRRGPGTVYVNVERVIDGKAYVRKVGSSTIIPNVPTSGNVTAGSMALYDGTAVYGKGGTETTTIVKTSTSATATPSLVSVDWSDVINKPSIVNSFNGLTGYITADYVQRSGDTMTGDLNTHSLIPTLSNTYDLGASSLPWRRVYASEFDTSTLIAGAVQSIGGKIIVAKDTGVFPYSVASSDTTIDFGKTMTDNDILLLQGLSQLEYIQVASAASGTIYSVSRNLDGSGANNWPAGAVWVDLGYNGDGYINIDAGSGAPSVSLNLTGTLYNNYTTPINIDTNGISILTKTLEYTAGKIKFATAAGVSVLDISTKEISAYEEDAYITAGSNFSGTDKSGYISILAKGRDTSSNNTSAAVQIAGGTNPLTWPVVRLTITDVTSAKAGTSNFRLYGNGATLDVPLTLMGLTYPSADGSANQVLKTNGSGTLSWTTVTSSTGANPTATAGLTAVNGSATTFLRSDGAPAIDKTLFNKWTEYAASGSLNLTNGLQDIPGCTTGSFTPSVAETVEVDCFVHVAPFTNNNMNANDSVEVDLLVDGVAQTRKGQWGCPVAGGTVAGGCDIAMSWVISLTAAAHTLKLQAKANASRGSIDTNTVMVVRRVAS